MKPIKGQWCLHLRDGEYQAAQIFSVGDFKVTVGKNPTVYSDPTKIVFVGSITEALDLAGKVRRLRVEQAQELQAVAVRQLEEVKALIRSAGGETP